MTMNDIPVPPIDLIATSSGADSEEFFLKSGDEYAGYLKDLAGLKASDALLDVGCGVGRIARALVPHLSSGTYRGFDVSKEQVGWCQENITPRRPNFQFEQVDIWNSTYNREGKVSPETFRFPYDTASFDVVFMGSIVTHLLPGSMENYLKETARVLKPQGRAFITWFLLDKDIHSRLDDKAVFHFPNEVKPGIAWAEHADRLEDALAYDEAHVRAQFANADMPVRAIHYGFWSGLRKDVLAGQDIVIAQRSAN